MPQQERSKESYESELDELRTNLAEAHKQHNMYRARMTRLVDNLYDTIREAKALTYKQPKDKFP
jgi:hypothetical protein